MTKLAVVMVSFVAVAGVGVQSLAADTEFGDIAGTVAPAPVASAQMSVVAHPLNGFPGFGIGVAADGSFSGRVPSGEYLVSVHDSSGHYEPYWYADEQCEADAVPITVTPDATVTLNLTVEQRPLPSMPPTKPVGPPPDDWLGALNWYRAWSGLPAVQQDPCGVLGQDDHIEYLKNTPYELRTGEYWSFHTENPASPWYTPEGALAGASSNITIASGRRAIESWMEAPYHALWLLHPTSAHVSFASDSWALLDMTRFVDARIEVNGPNVFPGNGSTLQLSSHFGEIPDPTDSCPGMSASGISPVGLPLIVAQLPNPVSPSARATLTMPNGEVVTGPSDRLCVITPSSDMAGSLDREVIVIYETELRPGRYDVTLSGTGSNAVSWSFNIVGSWPDPPPTPTGTPPCPASRTCDTAAFVDAGGRWTAWRDLDWPEDSNSFYYGNPGDYPFMGDWNCDGTDTPGLYRRSDGFVYLRNSNTQGNADIRFYFGNPGDLPLAGDFNGDGCDTVSIYRPSESRVFVINQLGQNDGGLGAAEFDYYFGNPGDAPLVGDFDGNGIDTVGLYRVSSGYVYFRDSLTTGIADFEFYYGNPGDVILAGDWDGDGDDTVAVYRPTTGSLYINLENAPTVADYTLPVGDYPAAVSAGRR